MLFLVVIWDNQYVLGQRGLFSRAEITAMYDATRRRNYSAAGERFRKEHQRHRDWGLEQRHRKKLCDLYGSVEAAEAHFAERARAALAPAVPEPRVAEAEHPAQPAPRPLGAACPEPARGGGEPPSPAGPAGCTGRMPSPVGPTRRTGQTYG